MKKGFALLLAAVMMLSGCGISSASSDTNVLAETAEETEKETQTAAAGTEEVSAEQTETDEAEAAANAAGMETESSSDALVIYFSRTGMFRHPRPIDTGKYVGYNENGIC